MKISTQITLYTLLFCTINTMILPMMHEAETLNVTTIDPTSKQVSDIEIQAEHARNLDPRLFDKSTLHSLPESSHGQARFQSDEEQETNVEHQTPRKVILDVKQLPAQAPQHAELKVDIAKALDLQASTQLLDDDRLTIALNRAYSLLKDTEQNSFDGSKSEAQKAFLEKLADISKGTKTLTDTDINTAFLDAKKDATFEAQQKTEHHTILNWWKRKFTRGFQETITQALRSNPDALQDMQNRINSWREGANISHEPEILELQNTVMKDIALQHQSIDENPNLDQKSKASAQRVLLKNALKLVKIFMKFDDVSRVEIDKDGNVQVTTTHSQSTRTYAYDSTSGKLVTLDLTSKKTSTKTAPAPSTTVVKSVSVENVPTPKPSTIVVKSVSVENVPEPKPSTTVAKPVPVKAEPASPDDRTPDFLRSQKLQLQEQEYRLNLKQMNHIDNILAETKSGKMNALDAATNLSHDFQIILKPKEKATILTIIRRKANEELRKVLEKTNTPEEQESAILEHKKQCTEIARLLTRGLENDVVVTYDEDDIVQFNLMPKGMRVQLETQIKNNPELAKSFFKTYESLTPKAREIFVKTLSDAVKNNPEEILSQEYLTKVSESAIEQAAKEIAAAKARQANLQKLSAGGEKQITREDIKGGAQKADQWQPGEEAAYLAKREAQLKNELLEFNKKKEQKQTGTLTVVPKNYWVNRAQELTTELTTIRQRRKALATTK